MPSGTCGSMSAAGTCGNACWRKPYKWRHAAPPSSSWPRRSPRQARGPPFPGRHPARRLPAHGKTGAGLQVYVRAGTTTWASLISGKEDANALLIEVLTPWGQDHVLAAHAPQINTGVEPYVRWWAGVWREATCIVDSTTVLVVTDTNSAARPADRGTPRPEDTGYRTFLRAFNLTDLVDPHPVPQGTYSYFQGTALPHRHGRLPQRGAVQHSFLPLLGKHPLSDHHVPLLFTVAFPVVRLDKPSPHTVSRTPEYHLGPVAVSPADAADFQGSVLRRRAIDPQLAPTRQPKACSGQSMIRPTPQARSGPSVSGTDASGQALRSEPPPRMLPNCPSRHAVCSPPWDVLRRRPKIYWAPP